MNQNSVSKMIKYFFFFFILLSFENLESKENPILAKVGEESIDYYSLQKALEKNISKSSRNLDDMSKDSLINFINLYANYRLKVLDAVDRGYLDDAEVKNEIKKQVPENKVIEKDMSKKKRKSFFSLKSKKAKIILGLVIFFILLGSYTAFVSVGIYNQAKITEAKARLAADSAKQQNIEETRNRLIDTKKEIDVLASKMKGLAFVGYIPFLGSYYNDAVHLINAATNGVEAGVITTETLIPYADLLGLKGESTFTGGTAQDRIRLAVQTMGKVVPEIDRIEEKILTAKQELDEVDPDRYPEIGRVKELKAMLVELKIGMDGAVFAVQEGKPLIKALPELLGESEPKRYLVLFQNDGELRATGGFLTFYSIFRIDEGVIEVEDSSDIYELDESIPSHPAPPDIVRDYLEVNRLYIRDSNLSPDFVESMDSFMDQYKNSSKEQDIDGIIALDTDVLVGAIRVLGEVSASGLTFTAENDERCDCPQVVYVLEDQISRPVNYIRTNRKGLISELMLALMNKALSSSPGQYWGPLFQQFIIDAQEKHIMFYVFNEDAQRGLEALNWAGRIKDYEGDYMHINDVNLGGAKSNLFISQSVNMDYTVSDNGEINKKVTIQYRNRWPHSDCDLESGGLCLNARLRNFQRFYVPQGSVLNDVQGSQVEVETKEELGKTYYESFLTVNPLGSAEIIYDYTLPFKLAENSVLPVLIQKQPGIEGIQLEITVNGKKVEEIDLRSDMELELNI